MKHHLYGQWKEHDLFYFEKIENDTLVKDHGPQKNNRKIILSWRMHQRMKKKETVFGWEKVQRRTKHVLL